MREQTMMGLEAEGTPGAEGRTRGSVEGSCNLSTDYRINVCLQTDGIELLATSS